MSRFLFLFSFLFTVSAKAQQMPAENDSLNFRIVGFSVPPVDKTTAYVFEIASGRVNNNYDFEKNIIMSRLSDTNRAIIRVPRFGDQYTWRVSYRNRKNKEKSKTGLYHFSTRSSIYTDTASYRLRIIDTATLFSNALVLFDHAPVMYDMTGNLVWYLPDIPGVTGEGRALRDLKPTPFGTFTLLNDLGAFEVDYYGRLIKKIPDNGIVSGDSSEHFHHELTRAADGHYWVAGTEIIERPLPPDADSSTFKNDKTIVQRNTGFYKKIDCPTIIELDSTGKPVWSWRAKTIFTDADYFKHRNPDHTYQANPHLNSFQFVKADSLIYISFRNFSRIVKITYPSGKVIAEYGEKTFSTDTGAHFHAQHCVRVLPNKEIILFNNNTDRYTSRDKRFKSLMSTVQRYREIDSPIPHLEMNWEFKCNIDTFALPCAQSGGGIEQIDISSYLVCVGITGRSFIVTDKGKLLWNTVAQRWDTYNRQWANCILYRTTFIKDEQTLHTYIFR